MALYCGIDLHSNNQVIVVADERDQRLMERRTPNDLVQTLDTLEPFRDELEGVVLESTYNWYWLVDGLEDHGYRVLLANTYKNQQYSGLKHTDDVHDAAWLAHLLRLGILQYANYLPREQRRVRDLMRKRAKLRRHQTAHWLMLGNQLSRERGWSGRIHQVAPEVAWDDPELALNWDVSYQVVEALDQQIKRLESRIHALLDEQPNYRIMQTIEGVGRILSASVVLETGDIDRFDRAGCYASYCRLVAASRYSNDKKKAANNRKAGNLYLSWAFHEIAHQVVARQSAARRFYQRKKARSNGMVAIRAVARKLARASYYMLRDHMPYDEQRLFQ